MRVISLFTLLLTLTSEVYGRRRKPVDGKPDDNPYPLVPWNPPWPQDYCRYSKDDPPAHGQAALRKSFENWAKYNHWGKQATWGRTRWWMERWWWKHPAHCREACEPCLQAAISLNRPWADCYKRNVGAKCRIHYRTEPPDEGYTSPEIPEHVTHGAPIKGNNTV